MGVRRKGSCSSLEVAGSYRHTWKGERETPLCQPSRKRNSSGILPTADTPEIYRELSGRDTPTFLSILSYCAALLPGKREGRAEVRG